MKKITTLTTIMITVLTLLHSCNTTDPPPPKPEPEKLIELKEITKSCTEAFIKVTVKDTILPASVTIQRDGKEVMSFYQTKTDTTIIDTGLAVAKTYVYKAIVNNKGEEGKSKEIAVSTLPTTSSNFTWQKYTFGDGGINIFRDVAIIDENDIWVVGETNKNDTSDLGYQTYNAVHWDGNEWELKRIMFYTICGQSHETPYPTRAIFVFNENEIWIALDGSQIAIIKDNKQISVMCLPFSFSIRKLWGSSNSDVYAVGDNGTIMYYNGTSWKKIESGTDYQIKDIYGDLNPFTNKTEILCSASAPDTKDSEVIKIKEDLTTEKLDKTLLAVAVGIWFRAGIRYYVIGNGLFEKRNSHNNSWKNLNEERSITPNFMTGIRGNGLNDIMVCGSFGELLHYNGLSWKSLKNEETTLTNGWYSEVAVKGNTVVAVGTDNGRKAVILVGKRN